jgi:hypothetical protein
MPLDPQIEFVIGLVKKANAPEFWQLLPTRHASNTCCAWPGWR